MIWPPGPEANLTPCGFCAAGLVETLETLGGLLIGEGRAERGLPLLAAADTARDGLGFPLRPMEAGRVAGWVAAGREHLGERAQPAWERGTGLTIEQAATMARRGRGPRRRPAFGWSSLTPRSVMSPISSPAA
jgi:hypothetical protein